MTPNSKIHFTSAQLANTGKVGLLPKDEFGYTTLVIGALGVYNSSNIFYVLEEARQLFENSSQFKRRVLRGGLCSELGHPKREPGMSDNEYLERYIRTEETNQCGHISDVWLGDSSTIKDSSSSFAVPIMGKVKGAGPHAKVLDDSIANPKDNTFFSIRSICDDYIQNGRHNRIIRRIIGFDKVAEPGIVHAEKWRTPGLECFNDVNELSDEIITPLQFRRFYDNLQSKSGLIAQESLDIAHSIMMDLNIQLPKGAIAAFQNWV